MEEQDARHPPHQRLGCGGRLVLLLDPHADLLLPVGGQAPDVPVMGIKHRHAMLVSSLSHTHTHMKLPSVRVSQ